MPPWLSCSSCVPSRSLLGELGDLSPVLPLLPGSLCCWEQQTAAVFSLCVCPSLCWDFFFQFYNDRFFKRCCCLRKCCWNLTFSFCHGSFLNIFLSFRPQIVSQKLSFVFFLPPLHPPTKREHRISFLLVAEGLKLKSQSCTVFSLLTAQTKCLHIAVSSKLWLTLEIR